MKVTVDTAHDSHEDIKKVIKMLQNLVGDSQEVFTNQPQSSETQVSPIANIFGDTSAPPFEPPVASEANQETMQQETAEEASESTEDLFAELFSEEELKKMDVPKEEPEEAKPKGKKYSIEFY